MQVRVGMALAGGRRGNRGRDGGGDRRLLLAEDLPSGSRLRALLLVLAFRGGSRRGAGASALLDHDGGHQGTEEWLALVVAVI
jgi:hypothetical protein